MLFDSDSSYFLRVCIFVCLPQLPPQRPPANEPWLMNASTPTSRWMRRKWQRTIGCAGREVHVCMLCALGPRPLTPDHSNHPTQATRTTLHTNSYSNPTSLPTHVPTHTHHQARIPGPSPSKMSPPLKLFRRPRSLLMKLSCRETEDIWWNGNDVKV